jgi:hypothetical protein
VRLTTLPILSGQSLQSVVQLAAGFYQHMDRHERAAGGAKSRSSRISRSKATQHAGPGGSGGGGGGGSGSSKRPGGAAQHLPRWPVAPSVEGFVAAAARLGTDPLLRGALQHRILTSHASLYGSGDASGEGGEGGGAVASAGAEWTALLARMGRRS